MTERNAYRCPNYVGVSCVDGSCPKALQDEYQERGIPCVWRCSDCRLYEGCKDCAFVRGQICMKTEDSKMEDKAKLEKVRLVDADKLMDFIMRGVCDDLCGLEIGSAECAAECLADELTSRISHYADRHAYCSGCAAMADGDAQQADVHGTWHSALKPGLYVCDKCSRISHVEEIMGKPAFDYCPHCGAKMDGDLR